MKGIFFIGWIVTVIISVMVFAGGVCAQSTAFTCQGRLNDSSNPANGNYDFEFRLFDSLTGGLQQGATLSRNNVAVGDGNFTVVLDFGADAFPGANRFLQIGVRLAGTPGLTLLAP